ncbi:hypothetical protein Tsubulata_028455 [Turnera subulata]|uniref:Phytocyanin domain-containing protein n=1 Tax=Turnera subulata TaxID=218843 RepID=A0A9Q0F1J4_9ROSI|nr:hypothetical protein Tsubulata_028455 [Turnera subulata]
MYQEKSRKMRAAMLLVLLCVLLQLGTYYAVEYTVGDGKGWSPSIDLWTNGKTFYPGDVLVFNYDATTHNVVMSETDRAYHECVVYDYYTFFQTGHDRVTLPKKGQFSFISGVNKTGTAFISQDCVNNWHLVIDVD